MKRALLILATLVFCLPAAAADGDGAPAAVERDLLNALGGLNAERLSSFVNRPLFAPSRRPPEVAPPPPDSAGGPTDPPPDAAGAEPPKLRLTGIIATGEDVVAVVRDDEAGTSLSLRVGDTFGADWVVTAIGEASMTLTRGDDSTDYDMFEPHAAGPAGGMATGASAGSDAGGAPDNADVPDIPADISGTDDGPGGISADTVGAPDSAPVSGADGRPDKRGHPGAFAPRRHDLRGAEDRKNGARAFLNH